MDLLMVQKPFEVGREEAALLRAIDENVVRIDLLVLELTKRPGLVHEGMDVRFLDWKRSFQSHDGFRDIRPPE